MEIKLHYPRTHLTSLHVNWLAGVDCNPDKCNEEEDKDCKPNTCKKDIQLKCDSDINKDELDDDDAPKLECVSDTDNDEDSAESDDNNNKNSMCDSENENQNADLMQMMMIQMMNWTMNQMMMTIKMIPMLSKTRLTQNSQECAVLTQTAEEMTIETKNKTLTMTFKQMLRQLKKRKMTMLKLQMTMMRT